MIKTLVIASGLLLSALGPAHESDPYVRCSYYHWMLVRYSRDTRDLDRMWEHLGQLDELAKKMALDRKISRDGAHAILRREAEAMLSYSGDNHRVIDDAGRACALIAHGFTR